MASRIRSGDINTPSKRRRSSKAMSQKVRRMPVYQSVSRNLTYGGPFPPIKKSQVVYAGIIGVPITTGSGVYVFSCNGLFDPDYTGTGTQPLYFDQLMAIYNHYVVTSCSIDLEVMNDNTNRSVAVTCYADDDTAGASNFTSMQRPGAKSVSGNPLQGSLRLKQFWSAYKNFGSGVENNSLFRGDSGNNPAEQMYFIIQVEETGLNTFTLPVRFTIRYNTTFSELKTIAGS